MNAKSILKSKTFYFNVLAVIILVANSFGFSDFSLDPEVAAGIIAVVNLLLRLVTKTAVYVR